MQRTPSYPGGVSLASQGHPVKRRRKFTAGFKWPLRGNHFRTGDARFWPTADVQLPRCLPPDPATGRLRSQGRHRTPPKTRDTADALKLDDTEYVVVDPKNDRATRPTRCPPARPTSRRATPAAESTPQSPRPLESTSQSGRACASPRYARQPGLCRAREWPGGLNYLTGLFDVAEDATRHSQTAGTRI